MIFYKYGPLLFRLIFQKILKKGKKDMKHKVFLDHKIFIKVVK